MNRRLPRKRSSGKGLRIFLWLFILFISVSGFLGMAKAEKAKKLVETTNSNVVKMQKKEAEIIPDDYRNQKVIRFADAFVTQYLTIPAAIDQREQYQKELQQYYAKDMPINEVPHDKAYRKLKEKEYFDTVVYKDFAVVRYKVTYENVGVTETEQKVKEERKKGKQTKEVVKTVDTEKSEEVTTLINLPIKEQNGAYSIVENVYFTAIPSVVTTKTKAIENGLADDKEVPLDEVNDVVKFTNDFFMKYAKDSLKDLAFVMAEPEGLGGTKVFDRLEETHVYQQKDKLIIKTEAVFKEELTAIENKERFTLTLIKTDANYFVEKLTHTLGGEK